MWGAEDIELHTARRVWLAEGEFGSSLTAGMEIRQGNFLLF